ncbi:SusC/RagA family TonB-linked outer membrane protein [Mucilaginibacter terrae]|uniref:SusC/RagA family TonB-linked outer membrane protein n=1 Tax=Mucilaginibacter terrae TaxID=1955052 RepID=UPI00363A8E7F
MRENYFKKYALLCLMLALSCVAFAQTGSITGKVLDNTGQPLPGVTVGLTSTTLGAPTDVDGNFRINNVPAGSYTITARFFGFTTGQQTVTVTAGANAVASFNLQPETKSLNEVVVIGYGTQTRKELTGAISTVTSKDFQKGTTTSPAELIQGKIAGVGVSTNSGQPGAGATIRIRQGASLNASNDPLIVVDGVPLSNNAISGVANPLSLINPDDIETFTVLKDAASTAIYGSRASNGVIIITTKKGTAGTPQVSFSSKNSIATLRNKVDVLSADEVRAYVKQYDTATGTNKSALLGSVNTDWQDQIYQNALTTDNNLSIGGTLNKMPYRVSVGYLDQQGILKTDRLQRSTAAIRLSPKFFNNDLKLDINLNGSYGHSRFANQGAVGAAVFFDPTKPVYLPSSPYNGYYEWYGADKVLNPNAPRNPVGLLNDNTNIGDTYRTFGNITADYRFPFLKALRANVNLGYDLSKGGGSTYVPFTAAQSFGSFGLSSQYHQKNYNTVVEAYLNYNETFKSIKSNFNATAGYGYYDFRTSNRNFASYGTNSAAPVITNSVPNFAFDIPQYRLLSYYGRLIYTYDTKYILAATIRTDGSSKFTPDNNYNYGVFPSVAFTWRMIDENFLKSSKVLSDLKLRLSYGVTGQQDGIPYYGYIPTYFQNSTNASSYQFGNTFYNTYSPSAYDSSLKWETTQTTNIGFDFGFFNQRISGSIDAYYKNTKDLLSRVFIPAGSNFSNQLAATNVGNMTNRGIELNLNAIAVKTKDITWNVNYNVAYNRNKVTNLSPTGNNSSSQVLTGSISGGTGNTIQVNQVGYSPNTFYVYKQVYDSKTGKPLQGVYEDLNNDGAINGNDLYQYNNPYPKFIMGFSTQFSYKKWTASTVLRAHLGNYMYNNLQSNAGTQNTIISTAGELINNANANLLETGFTNSQYFSDYYVQNASFLRMDNAGLAYDFGKIYRNKIRLNLSANVQNVFLVTKYKGLDPEIVSGIDNNFYPRPRTYTLSLNLGF